MTKKEKQIFKSKIIKSAKNGDLAELQNLIDQVEKKEDFYDLAFSYAVWEGSLETIKYLIEKDNALIDRNPALLMSVIQNGKIETLKYFIEKGLDIRARNDFVLNIACNSGRLEIMKYCIEEHNYHPETVFAMALKDICPKAVKYLIVEHGCSAEVALNFTKKNCEGNMLNVIRKEAEEIIKWCEKYLEKKIFHDDLQESLQKEEINQKRIKI